ncbi:MAG: hypothetical protein ACK4WC_00055 [Rubrimonas sp.]
MPRPRKPARLYQRPDTGEWIIRDGAVQRGTGARGSGGLGAAEEALRRYIAARAPERRGPARPDDLTVGEVLALYARERGPHVAAPERIGYAIRALAPFWGSLPCSDVTGPTCRRYEADRGVSASTVRRELGVLRAALRHAWTEGALTVEIRVPLPEGGAPRDRWLTREELRRLLRASAPHLRRFILIGVLTGTRAAAIPRCAGRPARAAAGWTFGLACCTGVGRPSGGPRSVAVPARCPNRWPG